MSGHSEKHNGGMGSPQNQSKQKPAPSAGQGKRREMRADFLLNFSRPPAHQRPAPAPGPRHRGSHGGRRSSAPTAFAKGRFVQSSLRLYVDSLTQDVVEAALSADSLLDWSSVRRADMLCEEHPTCPICLEGESMVVPKVTECGHVYCAPCVMRYLMTLQEYNGKSFQRCPVCNESITAEDLTSVRIQLVRPLEEGDHVTFVLAHRGRDSTILRLSQAFQASPDPGTDDLHAGAGVDEAEEAAGLRLPREHDRGWHLGRLLRLAPGEAECLIAEELEGLQNYRPAAIDAGDTELLPSIDAAVNLLRQQHSLQGGGSSSGSRGRGESAAAGWGCRYVEVPAPEFGGGGGRGRGRRSSSSSQAVVGLPSPDMQSLGAACDAELLELPERQVPLEAPTETGDVATQGEDAVFDVQEPSQVTPSTGPCGSPALGYTASQDGPQAAGGSSGIISFYQLADGRLIFMQPFFTRLLLHEHGGRWENLPDLVVDVRLERLHEQTVTEELRKRHRFLSHLPVGSQILFAEVDLRDLLSRETKEHFAEDFAKRRQQRKRDLMREKKEERISKNRAAVEEEKYYRSLNRLHPSMIQQVPTKDDFAVDLHGRASLATEALTSGGDGEAASVEAAATASGGVAENVDAGDEEVGPTLADKIKERMAAKGKPKKAGRASGAHPPPNRGYAGGDDESSFPTLGGGAAGGASSSAWGRGRGSSRVAPAAGAKAAPAPAPPLPVPDSWDDDEVDEQPSFGEALEAVLRRSTETATSPTAAAVAAASSAMGSGTQAVASAGDADTVAAESSAATATDAAPSNAGVGDAGKKKKGRAAKATTIRLFG